MSATDGNHATSNADSNAHDDDHGLPPPPEPRTPMWLPAVGALLFLGVGLAWALSPPAQETTDLSAIPAGTAAAADAGAAPKAAPARVEQPGHEGHGH